MEYDDGADVAQGDDLSLGNLAVGPASYDSDGDGTADSFIMPVAGTDQVDVLADTDGDGQVDTVYVVDDDGSVKVLEQDADGQWGQTGTGHVDDQGHIAGGTGGNGGDGGTVDPSAGGGDGIVLTDDGQSIGVGAPTVDLTGDGVNESVVLQGSDGSTLLVADSDGDGTADHILQINQDNSVTFAVPDGHGGWVVEGSGHIDANGNITQDSTDGAGTPYDPPTDLSGTTGGDTTGGNTAGGDTTGGDTTGGNTGGGSGEDITATVGDKVYDLGPATMDSNSDGDPDTVVVQGEDGSTLLVTDVDGDGTGDQMIQVNADGTATVSVTEGDGTWDTVATGHVDENGQLVIDQQTGTGTTGADTGTTGTTTGDSGTTTTGTTGGDGSGEDITATVGDKVYDLGPATMDSDSDGDPDTVVMQGEDGSTLLVTDTDGDGTGDQMIQVNADGTATVSVTDGDGTWDTVATGHVDENGQLVIDKQ